LLWKVSRVWNDLSLLSVWMIRVTNAKEAPSTAGSLEEHSISARVWRAIGDAMLHYMNINTGTKRFMEAFATSAVNYFFN